MIAILVRDDYDEIVIKQSILTFIKSTLNWQV